jgi:hypothetical protein
MDVNPISCGGEKERLLERGCEYASIFGAFPLREKLSALESLEKK